MDVLPDEVTLGDELTVITTVEVTTVHGPTPSGSVAVSVNVTVPAIMEGV